MLGSTLLTLGLAWAAILPSTLASPVHAATLEVHEKRSASSKRWTQQQKLDDDRVLPFKISLVQSNLAQGADHLMRLADPGSPDYGKHWGKDEVADFFQPSRSSVDTVTDWLRDSGIIEDRITYSKGRGILSFKATVAEADSLFSAKFHEYKHVETSVSSVGCEAYSLPRHVRQHIEFVSPTVSMMAPRTRKRGTTPAIARRAASLSVRQAMPSNTSLANCSTAMTPECIKTLYQIPAFEGTPSPNNSLGIYQAAPPGGLNESYSQLALDEFFGNYSSDIPQGTHPIPASINGAIVETEDPDQVGTEAMLDYCSAYPIVYPQTITAFVTNNSFSPADPSVDVPNSGVETFLDAVDSSYCTGAATNGSLDCGKYQITNVVSFSYGEFEDGVPPSYAMRVCNEFMKLSLQGVTIVAASGDDNVGDVDDSCGGADFDVFQPDWLATCPYVLAVGGTQLKPNADVTQPGAERSWFDTVFFGDGSGFSNYFPMPDYQNATVTQYLATANLSFPSYAQFANSANASTLGNGTDGLFNRLGRAYPDVSANAYNNVIYDGQGYGLESGTSAATPVWAAILTRINEERLAAGKSTVGFVNPTLYQNPDAFNDIIEGSNGSCDDGKGFNAQEGWDALTGLGTPIYPKLLEVFMNLP